MAVALKDCVEMHHILYKETKFFHSFSNYKNTRSLKFSSGGQLLVICDIKYFNIFDTYTLQKVHNG